MYIIYIYKKIYKYEVYLSFIISMNFDQSKLEELNNKFEKSSPEEIIKQSNIIFKKNKIVYVSSFGTESAVILHMISKIDINFPVVLLNTNFLFNQTFRL